MNTRDKARFETIINEARDVAAKYGPPLVDATSSPAVALTAMAEIMAALVVAVGSTPEREVTVQKLEDQAVNLLRVSIRVLKEEATS